MSLTETQQIYEALKNSQNALITFSPNANGDAVASSLALSLLLKKMNKNHEIVSNNFSAYDLYHFLPNITSIKSTLTGLRKFLLKLNLQSNELNKMNHFIEDSFLHIELEPKSGIFSESDLHLSHSKYKYDLIITISTPDLESLEQIFEHHTDFFYQTPILNIDHSTDNEYFGHYNYVNVTASSASEILYDLINNIDKNLVDEPIATCLLTGMILKTQSFRTTKVTPKSLNIAGDLIATGADRANIIRNLYQTKSLNTLKLWGKLLQKLELNQSKQIAISHLTLDDFKQTKSTPEQIPGVIEELITNIPTIKLTVIFYETQNSLSVLIKSENDLNLLEKLYLFNPKGNKNMVKIKLGPADKIKLLEKLYTIITK